MAFATLEAVAEVGVTGLTAVATCAALGTGPQWLRDIFAAIRQWAWDLIVGPYNYAVNDAERRAKELIRWAFSKFPDLYGLMPRLSAVLQDTVGTLADVLRSPIANLLLITFVGLVILRSVR